MEKKLLAIQFNMKLPVVIVKKEKWFVSSCPVLDVVTQGRTLQQAKKNLEDALSLFLSSCYERGTLDAVLKQCGFVSDHSATHTIEQPDNSEYIDVPLPFVIDMGNPRRCHA